MGALSTRSKMGREEIKWQELLTHFRSIQAKHEKARRTALGADTTPFSGFSDAEKQSDLSTGERSGRPSISSRPPIRRKVTGDLPVISNLNPPLPTRSGILSPLNPRARGQNGLLAGVVSAQTGGGVAGTNPTVVPKQRRTISLSQKP
jgi:vacuole morphology and inheritance protein 14